MWRLCVPVLALLSLSGLRADDWPAPRRTEAFSANGRLFVRITPGESLGDVFGFAGGEKGRYARAEVWIEREGSFHPLYKIDLVHPVAPVDVLFSNDGRLVTFDNWHNAGYGKVVAIYSPKGELIRAYELEHLYGKQRLDAIPTSVSSRWWRMKPWGWSDPVEQTTVYLHEALGGYFVFNLRDGSFTYANPEARPSGSGPDSF